MIRRSPRRATRYVALAVVLALFAATCGSTSRSKSATVADETVLIDAKRSVHSRFVSAGYEGLAYPVPVDPVPGPHVNDVRVELYEDDGTPAGHDYLAAGTPRYIRDDNVDPDLVRLDWDSGLTARASRDEFWRIPSFVEMRDIVVTTYGRPTPIGETDLLYNRVGARDFDDTSTPEFEAIAGLIRRFLECELDDWKIANQYLAVDFIADGLYKRDRSLVHKGVAGLDWGVAQDLDDQAVFSLYRECDDRVHRDPGETHHSSQWFAALGRGVYLLAASEYAGEFRDRIDTYIRHVEELATLLTKDDVYQHWYDNWLYEPDGNVFTHKFYMRAAGLGLAASLTADVDDAGRWGRGASEIARLGMAAQWESGVNPERGGFDVRYQMYGTWLAMIYRSVVVNEELAEELRETIDRAIEWVQSRIDDTNGQVDLRNNTRTCRPDAAVNEYHPYHMVSAFLYWGQTQPDHAWLLDRAVHVDAGHRFGLNRCTEFS